MCCLDIVRVIVSPCSSHTLRVLVIRNDVVVIREVLVANGAYSALVGESFGSEASASLPVIAVPDILADGVDLRRAELLVLRAGAWEGSPGHSRKPIYELGRIRWDGVS